MDNNFKYKNGGFPPLQYCETITQKNGKKERLYVQPISSKLLNNAIKLFDIKDDNEEQELNNIVSIN